MQRSPVRNHLAEETGAHALAREQTEGMYERVSRSGALPETAMTPENRPQYVHDHNASRRGESAFRRGEQPPPGVGSKGFGRKGPRKGSVKPDAAGDVDMTRTQEEAPLRTRGWGSGSSGT